MGLMDRFFRPKIAKLEDRGDVERLIAVVESEAESDLRVPAIEALARLEAHSAAPVLVAKLEGDDAGAADAARAALRQFGGAASDSLVAALGREGGGPARTILLELGDAAVEPLRDAAGADDGNTRLDALAGLLELRERSQTPEARETVFRALLAALGDPDPLCRMTAASGLEQIADPRAGRALAAQLKDGDQSVRDACRTALGTIGVEIAPNLVDALYDRNANSRRLAAELLGEVCGADTGTGTCTEVLAALLEHVEDSDAGVRDAVARSLGVVPAADVVARQLELLADPERSDRLEVLEFLNRLLDHAAVDPSQKAAATRRIEALGYDAAD
jgi:HEAT repeat protein